MAKISMDLDPNEVRTIAVLRAIKEVNQPNLINETDVGGVLALLHANVELDELESKLSGDNLRLFLRAFVQGLAASESRNVPQQFYEGETQYVGGPTGGAAELQGVDSRYVTNTGPQD